MPNFADEGEVGRSKWYTSVHKFAVIAGTKIPESMGYTSTPFSVHVAFECLHGILIPEGDFLPCLNNFAHSRQGLRSNEMCPVRSDQLM